MLVEESSRVVLQTVPCCMCYIQQQYSDLARRCVVQYSTYLEGLARDSNSLLLLGCAAKLLNYDTGQKP